MTCKDSKGLAIPLYNSAACSIRVKYRIAIKGLFFIIILRFTPLCTTQLACYKTLVLIKLNRLPYIVSSFLSNNSRFTSSYAATFLASLG